VFLDFRYISFSAETVNTYTNVDGALRSRTLLNVFTCVYTHLYLHIHTRKHVHLYSDVQNNEQMQKWMELFEVNHYYNILQ